MFADIKINDPEVAPQRITNYLRNRNELQTFLCFAIVVAGKNSKIQSKKLKEFYDSRILHGQTHSSIFDYIRYLKSNSALVPELMLVKMGQYVRISKAFTELVDSKLNLFTCSLEDLTSINGVSLKTANFFLTHSRASYNEPVLDTHILKFLGSKGIKVPKNSPQSIKLYKKLSDKFKEIAGQMGKSIAELDLQIWKQSSIKG
jgi:thermostable 8-oxoguanine DNA glycosylase